MGEKSSIEDGGVRVDQGIFGEEPTVAEAALIMNEHQALVVLDFF